MSFGIHSSRCYQTLACQIQDVSRLVGHSSNSVTELAYPHQIRPVIQIGATLMDRLFGGQPSRCRGAHARQWSKELSEAPIGSRASREMLIKLRHNSFGQTHLPAGDHFCAPVKFRHPLDTLVPVSPRHDQRWLAAARPGPRGPVCTALSLPLSSINSLSMSHSPLFTRVPTVRE
jgi:hypothetical protein